jgi:hypothetical protein
LSAVGDSLQASSTTKTGGVKHQKLNEIKSFYGPTEVYIFTMINTIKLVLRGHLWNKEKVVF